MKRTPLARKTPMKRTSALVALAPLKRTTPIKARGTPMRRSRSTTTPTVAQSARFAAIRDIGCLACLLNRLDSDIRLDHGFKRCAMAIEVHHILSGGRRIGHDATIGLCRWHHQGDKWPDPTISATAAAALYGPSFAREPNRFRAIYGVEATLLHWQDNLLKDIAA